MHSELKDAIVKQLEALPFGTEMGNDIYIDDETVRNLQEQLQLANKVSDIYIFLNYILNKQRVCKICVNCLGWCGLGVESHPMNQGGLSLMHGRNICPGCGLNSRGIELVGGG